MLPFLWLLLGTGIGAGGVLLVKRSQPSMLPGQIWTMVATAHPTKAWVDISKGDVARAIRAALESMGVKVIDAYWSGDYQLTVAVSVPSATQLKPGTVIKLGSEWADQATISLISQAPVSVPAGGLAPRFP